MRLRHRLLTRKPGEEQGEPAGEERTGSLTTADASLSVDALSVNVTLYLAVRADESWVHGTPCQIAEERHVQNPFRFSETLPFVVSARRPVRLQS